jgi:hypothetical protein
MTTQSIRDGRMRAVMAAAALLVGLQLTATAAPPPATHECGGRVHVTQGALGTWRIAAAPAFTSGAGQVSTHAVDPVDTSTWYASNGTAIAVSADAGCTWTTSFTLPATPSAQLPYTTSTDTITQVVVSPGQISHRIVFAVIARAGHDVLGQGSVGESLLLRSADAGRTWQPAPLAQPLGAPGRLAVAPSSTDRLYITAGGTLNVSDDAGGTWTSRAIPADVAHGVPTANGLRTSDVLVDPGNADSIWTVNNLFHSDDAGQTWAPVTAPGAPSVPGHLLLGRGAAGGPSRLFYYGATYSADDPPNAWWISDDGGAHFTKHAVTDFGTLAGGSPESSAQGTRSDDVTIATAARANGSRAGVWRFDHARQRFVDIDELHLAPLAGVAADVRPESGLSFHTAGTVVAFTPASPQGTPTPPEPPTLLTIPPFDPPPPPRAAPAALSPMTDHLSLSAGSSTSRPYRLDLPAQPRRLDVAFLLDTSTSTEPHIRGLALGLATLTQELAAAGVDAEYALAEFQDYSGDGVRYRLRSDLRRPDRAFQHAFEGIQLAGGFEPDYTAEDQLVTGGGILQPRAGLPIAAGQEVHWRDGSYRVVVHVTDEAFSHDPDGPTRDRTVADLVQAGVHVVGIEIDPGQAGAPTAVEQQTGSCPIVDDPRGDQPSMADPPSKARLRCQLLDLAAATHTLAPAGGVDCTGDGSRMVAEGRPLVCGLDHSGSGSSTTVPLAEPLRRMLTALRAPFEVAVAATLTPVNTAAPPATATVEPVAAPGSLDSAVDHVGAAALGYRLDLTCPAAVQGEDYNVELSAIAGGARVAAASLQLRCGDPPAAIPADTVPAAAPAGGAPVAVVGPPSAEPPPGQPPISQPVTQPGSAGQPASVPQPLGAVAPDTAPAKRPSLAYSPVRGDEEPNPAIPAAVMTFGFGALVVARQRRTAAASVQARR